MSIEKQLEESVRHSHILDNRLRDRQFEVQRLTAILTNLQNKTQESCDRYEQKIIQLQDRLAATEGELHTIREKSDRKKRAITQLEQKIIQLQEQLTEKEGQLNTAKETNYSLQSQLTEKEQLIAAMMTSKFWKIRSIWFKIKNNLGIKGE